MEAASQRYDLALEVLVQNPTAGHPKVSTDIRLQEVGKRTRWAYFLVEYFENLFVGPALQQLTMHLEAPDRLGAAVR